MTTVKKISKQKNPSSAFKALYVIFGPDAWLVRQETDKLLNQLLSPEQRDMALYQPEADKVSGAEVLDELRTLPFLAERRVVLMKDAEPFAEAYGELLEKYIDSPSPTGVLILTVESWDKRKKLAKKVAAGGSAELIEKGEIKPWDMGRFVADYAQSKGVRLDYAAANLLVELVGNEPGRIAAELDKIILFKQSAKTISAADVEELIGNNRVFDAFEVIDSLTGPNQRQAFDRLRRMFAADRDTEFTVIGAMGYHFRRLFRVKAMVEKGESQQTALEKVGLGKKSKIQERVIQQLGRYSLKVLGRLLGELGEMDYQAKTGKGDIKINMEKFFLRVTTLQKRA
ncbi:MAG: DNA polymerase III subunit delta [Planctomycetes bacterium]|nr:DNA polymerase III subunit delta [Planctomycetota bacterium]